MSSCRSTIGQCSTLEVKRLQTVNGSRHEYILYYRHSLFYHSHNLSYSGSTAEKIRLAYRWLRLHVLVGDECGDWYDAVTHPERQAQPSGLYIRLVEAGLLLSFSAGRRGLLTSSPPQFGQRIAIFAAQLAQNVHSNEQISAS